MGLWPVRAEGVWTPGPVAGGRVARLSESGCGCGRGLSTLHGLLRRNRVERDGARAISVIPPRGRPGPLRWPLHEATFHRIVMNIPHLFGELVACEDVAIVSAATLPEADGSVVEREVAEDSRVQFLPPRDGDAGDPAFELGEHGGDGRLGQFGPQQEVDVLGHDHPRVEVEAERGSRAGEVLGEEVTDARVGEQGEASVAGEGQEPCVVRVLESAQALAGFFALRHGESVSRVTRPRKTPRGRSKQRPGGGTRVGDHVVPPALGC